MGNVVPGYMALLDSQREIAFAALEGLTNSQIWQRPAPNEWSIGEILDHNYLLVASMYPILQWMWKSCAWYGRLRRTRPYRTDIEDLYRTPKFPHWVGFLWTPRHNTRNPVPLETLKTEHRTLHARICEYYRDKAEDVLGNLYLYDPLFGWYNLIVMLRICIYHDQLHYDDITRQILEFRKARSNSLDKLIRRE